MTSASPAAAGAGFSAGGFPLEPVERASVDELRALQLERLRRTLRHAWEGVPHYRKRFEAAGVHPDDLKSLDDLARFPFTTKSDLRENYPFGMFAVPRDQVVRIHASSGTTGKPTVVGYTRKDIDTWSDLVARSIRAAGARPGDEGVDRVRHARAPQKAVRRGEGAGRARRQIRSPSIAQARTSVLAMAMCCGQARPSGWAPSSICKTSSRGNQRPASSSVMSRVISSPSASAMQPTMIEEGKGQGCEAM